MNELDQPSGGTPQRILRTLMYAAPIAIFGFIAVSVFLKKPDQLDENLCPVNEPPERQTILLIDTSDPLTLKQEEELGRLVRELKEPSSTPGSGHFHVAPGERLIVYEIMTDSRSRNLEPYIEVCNPGNPDDWNFLTEGKQKKLQKLRDWQRFEEKLKAIFPSSSSAARPYSPILESLSVIMPRHVPSKRNLPADGGNHTHIILFSDLLQHSDRLSHYKSYPKAKDFLSTPKLRELKTDLTRVCVSIFRLERSKYSDRQTTDHYYWWPELVKEFNGTVCWIDTL